VVLAVLAVLALVVPVALAGQVLHSVTAGTPVMVEQAVMVAVTRRQAGMVALVVQVAPTLVFLVLLVVLRGR